MGISVILILGFSAVCFFLVGIGLSLERIGDILARIALNIKKGGEDDV